MENNSLITIIPPRSNYPRYIDPHKTIVRITHERDLLALAARQLIILSDLPADHEICKLLDSIYED